MIQNKAPGKDVSVEDMAEKFPLASKKNNTHFSNLMLVVFISEIV